MTDKTKQNQLTFQEKFNKTLKDFVGEITAVTPDLISKEATQGHTDHRALKHFYQAVEPVALELSTKNEIVFSKELTLLADVDLHQFWNCDLSETTRENTWKYLHTMYLYADNYYRQTNLGEVMKLYRQASASEHLKVDQKTQVLFGILDNLNNKPKAQEIVLSQTEKDTDAKIDELISDQPKSQKSSGGGLPGLGGLPLPGSVLNGKIGELATEIAKDINPDDFQMDNPEEMMRDLMSGKINQNAPVFNLVNQISSTIQDRLSSGEVDEMELFQEAKGVMSEMGSDNSPFGMLGKMSKTLEKEMANMPDLANMAGMSGMGVTPNRPAGDATRRQVLKDKLRNKKRQMELRKKLDQVKKAGK